VVADPLHVRPIAHAIWGSHFGQGGHHRLTQGGRNLPGETSPYSGLYHWWTRIGHGTTKRRALSGSIFIDDPLGLALFAGWLQLQPKFLPSLGPGFKERLNPG